VIGQYLVGPRPRYTVERNGACFTLRLAGGLPAAYGEEARFCFDDGTGAPVVIRVTNGKVVEERTATEVRPTVRPSDLRLRRTS
jgi:hypothetical protein